MFRAISRWTPTFAILAGIAYFAGHALTGEAGLIAWMGYKHRLAALDAELAVAASEHAGLEERAARLRDETLDLDYLEERARVLVGVGRPDDIIVPAGVRSSIATGGRSGAGR